MSKVCEQCDKEFEPYDETICMECHEDYAVEVCQTYIKYQDTINKLKAENEELKNDCKHHWDKWKEYENYSADLKSKLEKTDAENETLVNQLNKQVEDRNYWQSRCYKTEAICEKLAEALESVECGECNCGYKHCTAFMVPKALSDYEQFKKEQDE